MNEEIFYSCMKKRRRKEKKSLQCLHLIKIWDSYAMLINCLTSNLLSFYHLFCPYCDMLQCSVQILWLEWCDCDMLWKFMTCNIFWAIFLSSLTLSDVKNVVWICWQCVEFVKLNCSFLDTCQKLFSRPFVEDDCFKLG